jgi:hypothetical protein
MIKRQLYFILIILSGGASNTFTHAEYHGKQTKLASFREQFKALTIYFNMIFEISVFK